MTARGELIKKARHLAERISDGAQIDRVDDCRLVRELAAELRLLDCSWRDFDTINTDKEHLERYASVLMLALRATVEGSYNPAVSSLDDCVQVAIHQAENEYDQKRA